MAEVKHEKRLNEDELKEILEEIRSDAEMHLLFLTEEERTVEHGKKDSTSIHQSV